MIPPLDQGYYVGEHGPPSPKSYYGELDEATMQMDEFQSNDGHDHETNYSRYAATPRKRPPRLAESEAEFSPGYESDAESFGMAPSPTLARPRRLPPQRPDTQPEEPRPQSGGRSDDTVWERPDERGVHPEPLPTSSSLARRRPRSDGPFVYNSDGVIVSTVAGMPNNLRRTSCDSQHQVGPRLSGRDRENPTLLHPYVSKNLQESILNFVELIYWRLLQKLMNFTSPIDLLDDSPPQPVEEWRLPHAVWTSAHYQNHVATNRQPSWPPTLHPTPKCVDSLVIVNWVTTYSPFQRIPLITISRLCFLPDHTSVHVSVLSIFYPYLWPPSCFISAVPRFVSIIPITTLSCCTTTQPHHLYHWYPLPATYQHKQQFVVQPISS